MSDIKFDYEKALGYVSKNEIDMMAPYVKDRFAFRGV